MADETTFSDLYAAHRGKVSDKWESYLPVYDEAFRAFRDKPVDLLEIGIQNGGSLEVYARYFPRFNKIVGCDIDPKCAGLTYDSGIEVIVGDCNDAVTRHRITTLAPAFDIIIDDGSHTSSDIITTFLKYFSLLKSGGVFLIEDMHASYWQRWQGGLFHPESSIAFFKALIDVVNAEHWGISEGVAEFLAVNFSGYLPLIRPAMFAEIGSISFHNSVCVVRKTEAGKTNGLGRRIVKGVEASVAERIKLGDNSPPVVPNERTNPWSSFGGPGRGKPGDARAASVGRNQPCPCGSGKKYKYCHGQGG